MSKMCIPTRLNNHVGGHHGVKWRGAGASLKRGRPQEAEKEEEEENGEERPQPLQSKKMVGSL